MNQSNSTGDNWLIDKVRSKCTGADVHDVNGVIGAYWSCRECMKNPNTTFEQKGKALASFAKLVLLLSHYADGKGSINELKQKYKWW